MNNLLKTPHCRIKYRHASAGIVALEKLAGTERQALGANAGHLRSVYVLWRAEVDASERTDRPAAPWL